MVSWQHLDNFLQPTQTRTLAYKPASALALESTGWSNVTLDVRDELDSGSTAKSLPGPTEIADKIP